MAYPTSVATDADLHLAKNNLASTLTAGIDASQTTGITLASAANFPAAGFVTIGSEAIQYTSISVNTLAGVTRGADSTTAATHSSSDPVSHFVIAAHHNAVKDELIAVEQELINHFDMTGTDLEIKNNVSLGIAAGDGKFHVHSATAGSVTANAVADEIVAENNGNAGISILTPATAVGRLGFGDPGSNLAGEIQYNHNTPSMTLLVEGTGAITIDSTQRVGLGTITPSETLEVIGRIQTSLTSAADSNGELVCDGSLTLEIDNNNNQTDRSFFVSHNAGTVLLEVKESGVMILQALATEALQFSDAGSVSATEQDWIEVTVGGVTGFIRVFATK